MHCGIGYGCDFIQVISAGINFTVRQSDGFLSGFGKLMLLRTSYEHPKTPVLRQKFCNNEGELVQNLRILLLCHCVKLLLH